MRANICMAFTSIYFRPSGFTEHGNTTSLRYYNKYACLRTVSFFFFENQTNNDCDAVTKVSGLCWQA